MNYKELKTDKERLDAMVKYEDCTSCADLNNWRVRHIKSNIINIETLSTSPTIYRVWYEGLV